MCSTIDLSTETKSTSLVPAGGEESASKAATAGGVLEQTAEVKSDKTVEEEENSQLNTQELIDSSQPLQSPMSLTAKVRHTYDITKQPK